MTIAGCYRIETRRLLLVLKCKGRDLFPEGPLKAHRLLICHINCVDPLVSLGEFYGQGNHSALWSG